MLIEDATLLKRLDLDMIRGFEMNKKDKSELLWCGFCMLMGFIYVFMFWWG